MAFTPNQNFNRLIDFLKSGTVDIHELSEETQTYREFIEAFPADNLTSMTLHQYCIGTGENNSWSWWFERGLEPVLGRYMPGSSKGHLLYYKKTGEIYKHSKLKDLSDKEALLYVLKIISVIANTHITKDITWLDDEKEIYRRAGIEERVIGGEGRKLRILNCYHPDAVLPINSSEHLGHFLKVLGYPESEIPTSQKAIARLLLLDEVYKETAKQIPGLTRTAFMHGLYAEELALDPRNDEVDADVDEGADINQSVSEFAQVIRRFVKQAQTDNLKVKEFPKNLLGWRVSVSFGQGVVSHTPFLALLGEGQKVQKGIYPVFLYYKKQDVLILAYGVSATHSPLMSWGEVVEGKDTIENYFAKKSIKMEKYKDSFVARAFEEITKIVDTNEFEEAIKKMLPIVLDDYADVLHVKNNNPIPVISKAQFLRAFKSNKVLQKGSLELLREWRNAPNHEVTVLKFAATLGYSGYSAINSVGGNIAKRIDKLLDLGYKAAGDNGKFWIELLADFRHDPNKLIWIMKRELAMALDEFLGNPAEDNNINLNTILYGPPGTGKTFQTINHALEILDPTFLNENDDNRTQLKQRFDELVNGGHVSFVTFHQSLSYEDFVEGLRAEANDDKSISYEVVPGIFRNICKSAVIKVTKQATAPSNLEARKIWKMSLGNTLGDEAYVYDDCIENGYAILGYGSGLDFSQCRTREDIYQRFVTGNINVVPYSYDVTSVFTFIFKIKVGDLIVVTDGNSKFRAIGEVIGDYEYKERDSDFTQFRNVKWLRVYLPSLPYEQLMENRFSQMTVYELRRGSINMDKLHTLLVDANEANNVQAEHAPKVLIIDEINRGNISKIFGELITLIEPSKRAGQPEALSVKLPYSKETFSVPDNVYLIGTMNTADRSLAGLDIALRRRFIFKEIPPRPELLDGINIKGVNIGLLLRTINDRIEVLLDRDHCLGHTYFILLKNDDSFDELSLIFRQQIFPLLQEYFFEDWERIAWVLNDQNKSNKEEHAFLQKVSNNLLSLFGSISENLQDRRWCINEKAFNNIESYRAILATAP